MDGVFYLRQVRHLNRILSRLDGDMNEILAQYLEFGTRVFEMKVGIVSKITGDNYHVLAVGNNELGIVAGQEFELSDTLCSRVVDTDAMICSIDTALDETYKGHPALESGAFRAYMSAPIVAGRKIIGTINFTSPRPKEAEFSKYEKELLQFMADGVGNLLLFNEQKNLIDGQRHLLVEKSKFSAVGEMAATIAHEINNPLAIIRGFADKSLRSMAKGKADLESFQRSFEVIAETSLRIRDIVQGLKLLASGRGGDTFVKVKVNQLIESTLAMIKSAFLNAQVDLNAEGAVSCSLELEAQPTQIQQVLVNLLNNALDEMREREGEKWVKVECRQDGDMLSISVTDAGDGIPEKVLAHIFDPFYTTKEEKGSGIGLDLSRKIMQVHGGTLEYRLNEGHTCFELKLPIAERIR